MATRNITIAIDGPGFAHFIFKTASLTGLSFGVGPNTPITITEATANSLKAGKCTHNWFRATLDEPAANPFLVVQVITEPNASCNFLPDGLPGYHIDPGKDQTFTYTRDVIGNPRVTVV